MSSQTYNSGNRYYREQRGSRGAGYCVESSSSLPCDIPDGQMGRIIESIILPKSWMMDLGRTQCGEYRHGSRR